jgi:hypothetical protein
VEEPVDEADRDGGDDAEREGGRPAPPPDMVPAMARTIVNTRPR